MAVTETSRDAYDKVRPYIGADQRAVYEIIAEIGPCHDRRILEALNQKEAMTLKPRGLKRTWEINEVSGRRNEIVTKGYIWFLGRFCGCWHGKKKNYQFHAAVGDTRRPEDFGWRKYLPRETRASQRSDASQSSKANMKKEKRKGQLSFF